MATDAKQYLAPRLLWTRSLYMILFFFLYEIAEVVIGAVVVVQFLIALLTGSRNVRLLSFGRQLSAYAYEVFLFQTFNTETKPFPFGDWPKGNDGSGQTGNGSRKEIAALEAPPPRGS